MMELFGSMIMMLAILLAPIIFIVVNLNYQPLPRCERVDRNREYYNTCVKERGHNGPCRTAENRYFP